MPDRRVAVIGTTTDYIDIINRRYPGRALFLTDTEERARSVFATPDSSTELLCDLARTQDVMTRLEDHLHLHDITLSGVACYDDESLMLASEVAAAYGLPFVSKTTVASCRNKYQSRRLWQEAGVHCPRAGLIHNLAEAVQFMSEPSRPVVLKPLTGSGSELVYLSRDQFDLTSALTEMRLALRDRSGQRMYVKQEESAAAVDPLAVILMEDFIEGREFSCDFLLDGEDIRIIRIARKVLATDYPLGTALAYVVPGRLPERITTEELARQLQRAAHAVGQTHGICNADFIIHGEDIVFIEMAPRIGGDCLPPLIHQSCGLDMLGLALDVAEGLAVTIPPPEQWRQLVALRLFARCSGRITRLDADAIKADPRVVRVQLLRAPGHEITLPPEDYVSWQLGYVIFAPGSMHDVERECRELAARLILHIEVADDGGQDRLAQAGREDTQSINPPA